MLLDTDQILILVTILGITLCLVCICLSVLKPIRALEQNEDDVERGRSKYSSYLFSNSISLSHLKKENVFKEKHCPVCLENFVATKAMVKLPCAHIFHHECIEKWFDQRLSCPLCQKTFIVITDSSSDSETEND